MTNAQRQKRYRDRKKAKSVTPVAEGVTENPPEAQEIPANTRIASLEDYHDNPEDYALRACAELLNWGPLMSASELATAHFSGNRILEPGDWDYE